MAALRLWALLAAIQPAASSAWPASSAASEAAAAGPAAASATSRGCTDEPLQVLGPGRYVRVAGARAGGKASGNLTTCRELTGGACPIAVPFPGLDCMVNCIASEADCVHYNRRTPGVNPHVDPYLCSQCSISACEACEHHDGKGAATCKRCFASFSGAGGSEGRWTDCVIWDQDFIKTAALVFAGVLVICTLLLVFTTAVGSLKQNLSGTERSAEDLSQPLVQRSETSVLQDRQHNIRAIQQGLEFSVRSSIKFAAMREKELTSRKQKGRWRICQLWSMVTEQDSLNDMGIGLQLFFNTQVFLIVVAGITWMVASCQGDVPSAPLTSSISAGACPSRPMDLMQSLVAESPRIHFAENNRIACLALWLILLFVSWGFHYYQTDFIGKYDRKTHSAEDYTLRLTGVPETYTSEKKLKTLLEKELRMQDKIHGVCICYNILGLPTETQERLEHMLENLTEYDTWNNGWCAKGFCLPDLEERIEQDRDFFRKLITSEELRSSGEVYVCFKKQEDMVQVQKERRGIRKTIFEPAEEEHMDSLLTPGHFAANSARASSRGRPKVDPDQFVHIETTISEPSGIRFWAFADKPKRNTMMPLRMLLYIGIYAVAAQLFYSSMIRPWQDNFIQGAESSGAVAIAGKLVILLNFAIQTLVMVDVESFGNFRYLSEIDQRTFLWNTLLLVITNAYVIMQECYREGMRSGLQHPDPKSDAEAWWRWQRDWFQAMRIEGEVGKSLANVMTEQILMLYVIGEVANVLGPVVFYWVALRGVYVWRLGGHGSCFQGALQAMLPKRRLAHHLVTAREAEKAQILMPLLLWMEYTYIVIFAWMAFCTFFLATDEGSTVCGLLFGFAVIFYIWQRFVMLWMYGKATYDTEDSYKAFIHVWGFVLGILPPMSVWWTYRLNDIQEMNFAIVMVVLVFLLSVLIYQYGIFFVNWEVGSRYDSVDTFDVEHDCGQDPGYAHVMETHGYSWWNVNPIYVLKTRYCPDVPHYEVHAKELLEQQWPTYFEQKGFFELGKEFRHQRWDLWQKQHGDRSRRTSLVPSTTEPS